MLNDFFGFLRKIFTGFNESMNSGGDRFAINCECEDCKCKKVTATECGHEMKLKGRVSIFGKEDELTFSPSEEKPAPEYCLDCFAKLCIRCVWCGEIIRPGDPVIVLNGRKKSELPKYATYLKKFGYVGCCDSGCCYSHHGFSPMFSHGVWNGSGVSQAESFWEKLNTPNAEGKLPAALISTDTSDPSKTQIIYGDDKD